MEGIFADEIIAIVATRRSDDFGFGFGMGRRSKRESDEERGIRPPAAMRERGGGGRFWESTGGSAEAEAESEGKAIRRRCSHE